MVISVFNTAPGFQAYQGSRRARLQDQALRTEQEAMARRQAAFNNMLGQIQDPQRRAEFEMAGPQGALALIAQRDEQKAAQRAAQAESAAAAREQQVAFLEDWGGRYARERATLGDEFDENAFMRNARVAATNSGVPMSRPDDPNALPEAIRSYSTGVEVDSQRFNNPQRGVNPETGREEFFVSDPTTGQPRFIGVEAPATSGGSGLRVTFNEDGTIAGFEQGPGVTSSVYNQTRTTAGRAQTEALQGTGDLVRVRNYVGSVWSLPPVAFGPGGRTLEAGVRAAEAASSLTGIVDAILGGDTAGVSQEAVDQANDAFQNATGMTLQEYQALRSEGTFLVGRLLPVVTGDTRFTEMERMITETATGVRNLDDIMGSQSAARGASMATYGVALQEQAIRNFRAGTPPPYAALTELRPDASFEDQTPQAQEAIGQFIDDLVASGLSYDDAVEQSAIMAPIYADHLRRVGDYNNSVLDRMLGQISGARQNAN